MKIRYLISGLFAGALAFTGCVEPDGLIRTDSAANTLSVTGYLTGETNANYKDVNYSGVIDLTAGTVTMDVPWFMSDTEEVQADLTNMTVRANSMPIGAKFEEPGLAGIHDLSVGITRTLVYEDGTRKDLTIKARYVKSSNKQVAKVSFPSFPTAIVLMREPASGADGNVVVLRLSTMMDFMESGVVDVSPWATYSVSPASADNGDGTFDLTGEPTITVTAQDGSSQKYKVVVEDPNFVPAGEIGYRSLLFSFQTTPANPRGFTAVNNRTLTVVGDYLVVSDSSADVIFPVFNRFTGEKLDITVDNTGLIPGTIHAITTDDGGHMVAVSFAAANNQWVANTTFEVYVWKDGITNAPTKVFTGDLMGGGFTTWRTGNNVFNATNSWDVGRHIAVKGDMTTGKAMLTSFGTQGGNALILRMPFVDGVAQSIPRGSIKGLVGGWSNKSKVIPLDVEGEECPYYMNGVANRVTYYYPGNSGTAVGINPGGQPSTTWTVGNVSMAYTEFNGVKLVAVANQGGDTATKYFCVCVADVTSLPASFDGFKVLNSRMDNYDPARGPMGPGLQNSSLSGMTSSYGAIGTNGNNTGDVCFGRSADGNSVQVYMLVTDCGILAYELTRYDL
jgi:hypothetical protein